MIVLQLLIKNEIISEGHEQRIDRPDNSDDACIKLSQLCKPHCSKCTHLDSKINHTE